MQSMTGYAKVVHEDESARVTVELKSLNNRFLKVMLNLPPGMTCFEAPLIKTIKQVVLRGTVSLNLHHELTDRVSGFRVDKSALRQYRDDLGQIFSELGIGGGVNPDTLVQLPGVIESSDLSDEAVEESWPRIECTVLQALERLSEMRAVEGRFLGEDLQKHLEATRKVMSRISDRVPQLVSSYRERLMTKLRELLDHEGVKLSNSDVVREVAVYSERVDISEEIARISSHLEQFDETLAAEGEIGRRLEFLAQELFREANTMGAKSGDAEVSRACIELKSLLEKIKEQLQNVE